MNSKRWLKRTVIRPLSAMPAGYRAAVSNNGEISLRGETALITGGARGIGLAIAIAFARAHASVALVARTASELSAAKDAVERTGGSVVVHSADVTDEAAMAQVIESVRATLGPITILVNNAGSIGPISPFGESALDDWWRCVEVNLRGPVVCTQLVVHDMAARGHGRILNIVSGGGIASLTYLSAYVASKTAVVRWTECIASELAPYGVRAFAMEPGTVATSMSRFSLHSADGRRWIPWFKGIFDLGLDSPIDRVADRAVELAAGTADALSGRYIPLADDLATLTASEPLIRREALYSLAISRMPDSAISPRAVALRDVRATSLVASPTVVRLRRRLPVTAAQAFELWRDGVVVGSWFLPTDGVWIERPTLKPVVGGEFSLRMSVSGEQYHIHGVVTDATPNQRLVLDWSWESSSPILGSGASTRVSVEILSAGGGADVVITHDGMPGVAVRDAYIRGWRRCLEGMQRVIDGAPNWRM